MKPDTLSALGLAGWTPIRLFWSNEEPCVDWCRLPAEPFREPFFEQTVGRAMMNPARLLFRRQTPVAVLETLAREFVHHGTGVPLVKALAESRAAQRSRSRDDGFPQEPAGTAEASGARANTSSALSASSCEISGSEQSGAGVPPVILRHGRDARATTPDHERDARATMECAARPAGFIFHGSRCGSTLITQMLAALPQTIVLSEPPLVNEILTAHWRDPRITREQRIAWLRGAVYALARIDRTQSSQSGAAATKDNGGDLTAENTRNAEIPSQPSPLRSLRPLRLTTEPGTQGDASASEPPLKRGERREREGAGSAGSASFAFSDREANWPEHAGDGDLTAKNAGSAEIPCTPSPLRSLRSLRLMSEPNTHRLFIKFDCFHVFELPLITEAFPEVPWVFVYRDPVEVLVSHQRDRAGQLIPGVCDPRPFGIGLDELPRISADEYTARVLAAVYAAAQAGLVHGDATPPSRIAHDRDGYDAATSEGHVEALAQAASCLLDDRNGGVAAPSGNGRLINFTELPAALWDEGGLFSIDWAAGEIATMRQASRFNAKRPDTAFADDRPAKQREATEEIRRAASNWLEPVYAQLEALRAASRGPDRDAQLRHNGA